jgi:hypothetical protein
MHQQKKKMMMKRKIFMKIWIRFMRNAQKEMYKIITGDLNAKIGKEEIYRPIIRQYSLHALSNDNGIRLTIFACSKNMVVASTFFSHRDIHKMAWRSLDGQTYNQIDHLLIDV